MDVTELQKPLFGLGFGFAWNVSSSLWSGLRLASCRYKGRPYALYAKVGHSRQCMLTTWCVRIPCAPIRTVEAARDSLHTILQFQLEASESAPAGRPHAQQHRCRDRGDHVGNTTLSGGSLRHRRRGALRAESGLSVNYRILEPVLAYCSHDFDSKC